MKLIKMSYLITGIGNLLFLFSVIFFFCGQHVNMEIAEKFAGVGIFMLWASLTSYLTNPHYTIIWRTFEKAMPIMLRVHLGVLSYVVACAILGITILKFAALPMGNLSRAFMFIAGSAIGDNLWPWLV